MSLWDEHKILDKVVAVLKGGVTLVNEETGHHYGRPYMTTYQLAIKLERANKGLAAKLGKDVGGAGIGSRNSMAQYLGSELARRIKREGTTYPVEGAFLSNDEVSTISYRHGNEELVSSVTNSGYDISIFRWRVPASEDLPVTT
jgi:hypothetical protein